MKAKIDINAAIGGVSLHVRAGDPVPQVLVDHWAVSNSLIRAIRQGLVEDDEAPAAPVKKSKPAPIVARVDSPEVKKFYEENL